MTGGARSGKSSYAEELARKHEGEVLFVATAEAGDEEMRRRIEKHKQSRPGHWRTLETPLNAAAAIRQGMGDASMVLLDCITLLVNNILCRNIDWEKEDFDAALIEKEVAVEIDALIGVMSEAKADFVLVTNEVGLGIIPGNAMGRLYRDLLGKANQMLAAAVDNVYMMVSGLPLRLKG